MNISQLDVEEQIIELRSTQVILDSDIATLYGVETRDINKAVKNNPDKFPENYIFQLNKREKNELVENFHRFNGLKHSTVVIFRSDVHGCHKSTSLASSEHII